MGRFRRFLVVAARTGEGPESARLYRSRASRRRSAVHPLRTFQPSPRLAQAAGVWPVRRPAGRVCRHRRPAPPSAPTTNPPTAIAGGFRVGAPGVVEQRGIGGASKGERLRAILVAYRPEPDDWTRPGRRVMRFAARRVPQHPKAGVMKNTKDDGVYWTVDQIIVDPDPCIGVLEFTRFDGKGGILRGLELYEFDPVALRILEVRPYTAAPIDFGLPGQELPDFDYAGRDYPTTRPA